MKPTVFLVTAFLWLPLMEASLPLFPLPSNHYVANGEETTLAYRALSPIGSCTWYAPNGTAYNISPGQSTNDGGISYYNRNSYECGLRINETDSRHHGSWKCLVNYPYGMESSQSYMSIRKASKPSKVEIEIQIDFEMDYNITIDDKAPLSLICRVYGSFPAPMLIWYLDNLPIIPNNKLIKRGVDLPPFETEDGNYSSGTSIFLPEPHHKKIRCVVHLGENETMEDSVDLFEGRLLVRGGSRK